MAKVTLLCGKVGSGKTYYANKLKAKSSAVILSCDELMLKLFDSCLGDKHDQTVARCLDYLFGLAVQLYESGTSSILDIGLWTKAERARALSYFADRGIPCELIYIRTSENLRLERLEQRNVENAKTPECTFIIDDELRIYLDGKFQELSEGETYTIVEN